MAGPRPLISKKTLYKAIMLPHQSLPGGGASHILHILKTKVMSFFFYPLSPFQLIFEEGSHINQNCPQPPKFATFFFERRFFLCPIFGNRILSFHCVRFFLQFFRRAVWNSVRVRLFCQPNHRDRISTVCRPHCIPWRGEVFCNPPPSTKLTMRMTLENK